VKGKKKSVCYVGIWPIGLMHKFAENVTADFDLIMIMFGT